MEIITLPLGRIGANCYFLINPEAEDCILIDPGDEPDTVIRKLDSLGLTPKYILITHGHPDHVGAVAELKSVFPETQVMIHEADASKMGNRPVMHVQTAPFQEATSDGFYKDGDEVVCEGIRVQVIHTPGHSPGGVCLYVEEDGSLFSGDTLFRASVGRWDFPGGNMADLEASIKDKLYTLPQETVVYPGHSSTTTIGDEMLYNPFIRAESGDEG